jgi:hypothetical protein
MRTAEPIRGGCWGLVAFLLGACGAGAAPPAAPEAAVTPRIMVPFGPAPQVDGKVTPDEWRGAHRVEIGAGAHLSLMHDGAHVYLAVSQVPAHGFGLACVFIAEADRVHVLHASAQLGSAIYAPSKGELFDPRSKEYAWKPPADILREEGWMAGRVGEGSDGSAQEFRIALTRLGLSPDATITSLPIAVGYSYLNSDTDRDDNEMSGLLTWPSRTGDAVANIRLLGGWNPDQVRFAPERWARLTLTRGPRPRR